MTEKEKNVQRALGLLNMYHFVLHIPPLDDRGMRCNYGSDQEVGMQIESTDLDSACIQLEIEVRRKYVHVTIVTVDTANARSHGIE